LRTGEFYLKDECHNDTFTHGDEQQLTHSQWYFHRMGSGYKGGSFKGLDITFSTRGYGGILIRALYDIENEKYIEGPCNLVNHILSLTGAKDIDSLVKQEKFNWKVDQESVLYIRPSEGLEKKSLISCARFGLVLRTDDHVPFFMKPYRFFCYPELVRKGRHHLVLELHDNGKSKDEIFQITKCTKASLSNYIQFYEQSKEKPKKPQDYYNNPKMNNEEFCKCYQVLRQECKK